MPVASVEYLSHTCHSGSARNNFPNFISNSRKRKPSSTPSMKPRRAVRGGNEKRQPPQDGYGKQEYRNPSERADRKQVVRRYSWIVWVKAMMGGSLSREKGGSLVRGPSLFIRTGRRAVVGTVVVVGWAGTPKSVH